MYSLPTISQKLCGTVTNIVLFIFTTTLLGCYYHLLGASNVRLKGTKHVALSDRASKRQTRDLNPCLCIPRVSPPLSPAAIKWNPICVVGISIL